MGEHQGEMARHESGREASEGHQPCPYLTLDLQLPGLGENYFLLFKPATPWHFILASSAHTDHHPPIPLLPGFLPILKCMVAQILDTKWHCTCAHPTPGFSYTLHGL